MSTKYFLPNKQGKKERNLYMGQSSDLIGKRNLTCFKAICDVRSLDSTQWKIVS